MYAYRKFTASAGDQVSEPLPKVLNEEMVLFIVHCFPKVNGIFALPLAKASLFQRVSYLQVMNYCPKALGKRSGWEGTQCCTLTLKRGHFLNMVLLLAGALVGFWVSSD